MPVRAVDDKPSDTLVVVSGEGFWTGSSTLPHLHHNASANRGLAGSAPQRERRGTPPRSDLGIDPEPPVIPELGGSLPPTGLRLTLPGLTPTFRLLRRLPNAEQVVEAFRSTNQG